MKKLRKRFLCSLLVFVIGTLICGCVEKLPGENSYLISLPERELSAEIGETVILPLPQVTAPSGEQVDADVLLEIVYENGNVYMPRHRSSLCSEFAAYEEGKYYAVYTLEINGETVAKEIATVDVAKAELGDFDINGVAGEALYSSPYTTGVNGALSFRYYAGQNGLYIVCEVADTQLVYNDYIVSRTTGSDGFEVCFDFGGEKGDMLNSSCRKIRVCVNGRAYVYSPSPSLSLYELNEGMTAALTCAMTVNGTVCEINGNTVAAADTDKGYVFEAYLSYKALGVEPAEDIGIAFTHRDITSAESSLNVLGGAGNLYYSDIVLPEGLIPVLSQNGKDYEYAAYEAMAFTKYYSKLKLGGDQGIVAAGENGG